MGGAAAMLLWWLWWWVLVWRAVDALPYASVDRLGVCIESPERLEVGVTKDSYDCHFLAVIPECRF